MRRSCLTHSVIDSAQIISLGELRNDTAVARFCRRLGKGGKRNQKLKRVMRLVARSQLHKPSVTLISGLHIGVPARAGRSLGDVNG